MYKKTLLFLAALLLTNAWQSCRVADLKRKLYETELEVLRLKAEGKAGILSEKQKCLLQKAQNIKLPELKAAKTAAEKLKKLEKQLKKTEKKQNKQSLRDILKEIERLEKETRK